MDDPGYGLEVPRVLISYLRRGSAYTSTLDLLEALKQNGIPVVMMPRPGDNHGGPYCFPCCTNITCQF